MTCRGYTILSYPILSYPILSYPIHPDRPATPQRTSNLVVSGDAAIRISIPKGEKRSILIPYKNLRLETTYTKMKGVQRWFYKEVDDEYAYLPKILEILVNIWSYNVFPNSLSLFINSPSEIARLSQTHHDEYFKWCMNVD